MFSILLIISLQNYEISFIIISILVKRVCKKKWYLTMSDINYIFFLSLTIIVLGYIVKKTKIISEENGKAVAKVVLNITLPALILDVISNIEIDASLILLPIICVLYCSCVVGISFIFFKKLSKDIKGIQLMTISGFNIGLFAFPLIQGIWGEEGLKYIAMVDIGNAFIMFGLNYIIATKFSPKLEIEEKQVDFKYIAKKLLTSIPLIAYIVALFINLSGLTFPLFVYDVLDILSAANMALTLLLLGIYLNFQFDKSQWFVVLKVLIIRYGFGLLVGILLYIFLPVEDLYRATLLIGLILPIGMAVVPFAIEFEYNEKIVGMIVNFTIIISFILMWIIVLILNIG